MEESLGEGSMGHSWEAGSGSAQPYLQLLSGLLFRSEKQSSETIFPLRNCNKIAGSKREMVESSQVPISPRGQKD